MFFAPGTPEAKADSKAHAWARRNHTSVPCECDPRNRHKCTKSGWVRCNKRLSAIGEKRAELMKAASQRS